MECVPAGRLIHQGQRNGNVEGMQRGSAAAPFDGGSIATPNSDCSLTTSGSRKVRHERAHKMLLLSRKATIRKNRRRGDEIELPDSALRYSTVTLFARLRG